MEPARPLKNKLLCAISLEEPKTRLDTFLKDVHSEQIEYGTVAAVLQADQDGASTAQVCFLSAHDIIGHILVGRFKVGAQLDSGNFGKIHHCTDLQDTTKKLVVKISPNLRLIGKEVRALQHIGRDTVPHVLSSGIIVSNIEPVEKAKETDSSIESVFADQKDFVAYYVMPRFGRNLEVLHAECNYQFSSDTIL